LDFTAVQIVINYTLKYALLFTTFKAGTCRPKFPSKSRVYWRGTGWNREK